MKLEQYRTLWGVIDTADGELARSPVHTVEQAFSEIKALGYDGVEDGFKRILGIGIPEYISLLKKYGLKLTVQIATDGPNSPGLADPNGGPYKGYTAPTASGETDKKKIVETHLKVFKEQVQVIYQELNPTLINCQSLKDYFTSNMAAEFFTDAMLWQKEKGYFVCHETHRKRFLHSPWVCRDFLPKFHEMKLTADLSHFCCVAETSPSDLDLTQVVEDLAPQVYHTHCRVGYDHGPQVPDPRAPEWITYMEGHERWWDKIWQLQAERGLTVTTMIAEHGPPNYQPSMPYSRQPVAHIWDVNHWIHLRRQARFAELFGAENTSKLKPSATQGPEPVTAPGDSVLKGQKRKGFLGNDELLNPHAKVPKT